MVLPSDERLVILAESMEHLAAVLKPLAQEKTVGGEACLAAMKRTRNPGYALRRGDACVALYQRQRCRKRARQCLAPTKRMGNPGYTLRKGGACVGISQRQC